MQLDFSAFEDLFQLHYKSLARASCRIVGDEDVAEDIVQDIFCKFWEKKDEIQITTSLKSYLYQSTINHSLNHIKKLKRSDKREEFFVSSHSSEENNAESQMALKEIQELVKTSIDLLPNACRTVFVLSRFQHLSYKEIASNLGISPKTVDNQMVKALKHLRKHLRVYIKILLIFFLCK
jgi:RNA polymerase sigma-70 factor, ECF subfamily